VRPFRFLASYIQFLYRQIPHRPCRLTTYADACQQTLILYDRAADEGSCTSTDETHLQSRVNRVNEACCEANGVNICTGGAPTTCDAVCANEFVTRAETWRGQGIQLNLFRTSFALPYKVIAQLHLQDFCQSATIALPESTFRTGFCLTGTSASANGARVWLFYQR
jgi:hypothetical protein